VLTSLVAPAGLAVVLVFSLRDDLTAPYEDYPAWLLLVFGWLMVLALPLVGFLLARLPWRAGTHLDGAPPGSDPAAPLHATSTTDAGSRNRPVAGHDEGGLR
jgi:neurotransmitter:Na+ symporter, NSS family